MTRALWTYQDILKVTNGFGGDAKTMRDRGVYGVAIDSRKTSPGDLFVSLPGEASDGHDHVDKAFHAGAFFAIVSKAPFGIKKDDPRLIWVNNVYQGLLDMAFAARDRMTGTVIAVTGTAGKTSTKDILQKTFSLQGPTHAAVKSFNNQVGVPLTLARMPQATRFGVFEVGMNAPGDIAPLSALIRPHVALITTVGKGHLAAFKNEAEIAQEKAAIFTGVEAGGTAILNMDNDHFALLKEEAKKSGVKNILGFSTTSNKANARLVKSAQHADCSCLSAKVDDTTVTYKVSMPGGHWVANSLGILLTTKAAGGDLGLAGLALAGFTPQAGRGMIHEITTGRGVIRVVDESYNANPSSLRAALEVFGNMEPGAETGKKIAVLGDMEELGNSAKAEHLKMSNAVKAAGAEVLYVKGPGMTALLEKMKPGVTGFSFSDIAGINQKLIQDLAKGDVILVKGSRTAGLDKVVKHLKELELAETAGGWGTPMAAAE